MNLFCGVQPALLQPLLELRPHHVPHTHQAHWLGVK